MDSKRQKLEKEIADIASLVYSNAKQVVYMLGDQINVNTKVISIYNYYFVLEGSDLKVSSHADNKLLLDKTGFNPTISLDSVKELMRFAEAFGRSRLRNILKGQNLKFSKR